MEYEYKQKKVNLAQLIAEAGIGDFGLKTKGEKMWFIFEIPLSASDKTKLDNAVENHVADPEEEPVPTSAEEKLNQIRVILNK